MMNRLEPMIFNTQGHTIEKAELGTRLMAQLLDGVVLIIAMTVFISIRNMIGHVPVLDELLTFTPFLYFLLCDGLPNGQSFGKRMTKIATVSSISGKPCSFFESFLRNITGVLGWIDWLFIFGPKKQRLGDKVASTIVIKVSQ